MIKSIFLRKNTHPFALNIKNTINALLIFTLFIFSAHGKTNPTQDAYKLYSEKNYSESRAILYNLINKDEYTCILNKSSIENCINAFLIYYALSASEGKLKDIRSSINYLTKSYETLRYIDQTINPNNETTNGNKSIEVNSEANWENELAKALNELENTQEAGSLTDLLAFTKILNEQKTNNTLFSDENFWQPFSLYNKIINSQFCDSKPSINEDNFNEIITNNQNTYFEEGVNRLNTKLNIDESNNLSISDILIPSTLDSLLRLISAIESTPQKQGQISSQLRISLNNCVEELKPTIKLGIEKAISVEIADTEIISRLEKLSYHSLLGISSADLVQLKFLRGKLFYQANDKQQGELLMTEALNQLINNYSFNGETSSSFINQINIIHQYAKIHCSQSCDNETRKKIKNLASEFNDLYENLSATKWHIFSSTRSYLSEESEQLIKALPGGAYSVSFGIFAELVKQVTDRIVELKSAEIYLITGDQGEAKKILFYHELPNDIYDEYTLAYQYYLSAKWHEIYGEKNSAEKYWLLAVNNYDDRLPIFENYFEAPQLFAHSTAIYEEVSDFYRRNDNAKKAIIYLERARAYSSTSQKRTDIDSKSLLTLKNNILADYDKLLKEGAKIDPSILKKLKYHANKRSKNLPQVSGIFHIADYVSFIPETSQEQKYVFASKLNYYELSKHQFEFNKSLTKQSDFYTSEFTEDEFNTIQKSLPDNHLVVGIWRASEAVYVYTFDQSSLKIKQFPIKDGKLVTINKLYSDFIEPQLQKQDSVPKRDHVVFLVNSDYAQLPLAAMTSNSSALIDIASISYLPKLNYLYKLAQQDNSSNKAVFFDSHIVDAVRISSEREQAAISSLVSTQVFKSENATRKSLYNSLNKNSIIHISSHANLDILDPRYSYFELNDGLGHSDKVFNYELDSVSFDSADLTVLNACKTAGSFSGLIYNEFLSLPHTIMKAGSNSVISSISNVPDDIANEFSTHFYQELSEGKTISQAFHSTQQHLRKQKPNSTQWAYYVLNANINGLNKTY